jgi:hypothetical protein
MTIAAVNIFGFLFNLYLYLCYVYDVYDVYDV